MTYWRSEHTLRTLTHWQSARAQAPAFQTVDLYDFYRMKATGLGNLYNLTGNVIYRDGDKFYTLPYSMQFPEWLSRQGQSAVISDMEIIAHGWPRGAYTVQTISGTPYYWYTTLRKWFDGWGLPIRSDRATVYVPTETGMQEVPNAEQPYQVLVPHFTVYVLESGAMSSDFYPYIKGGLDDKLTEEDITTNRYLSGNWLYNFLGKTKAPAGLKVFRPEYLENGDLWRTDVATYGITWIGPVQGSNPNYNRSTGAAYFTSGSKAGGRYIDYNGYPGALDFNSREIVYGAYYTIHPFATMTGTTGNFYTAQAHTFLMIDELRLESV